MIRRYTDNLEVLVNERLMEDSNVMRVWVGLFRGTLFSEDLMCPATVLGAAALDGLGDRTEYDRATSGLLNQREAA